MQEKSKNWYTHPSKNVLILITFLWLLGIILLLSSLTNNFQESLVFDVKATLLYGMIGGSIAFVLETIIKYLKNKKERK